MDHFKVVYIKESQEIEPVPHQWEANGILYWPPTKSETRKKQSDVKSVPIPDKWTKYNCVVKAQGIALFVHASATADKLCQETSTDDDDDQRRSESSRRVSKPPARYYNTILKDASETFSSDNDVDNIRVLKSETIVTKNSTSNNCVSKENNSNSIFNININNVEHVEQEQFDTTIVNPENNVFNGFIVPESDIAKLGDLITEVSNVLGSKISDISAKIDHLEDLLLKYQDNETRNMEKIEETEQIFPLDNIENVIVFEGKLNDEQYRQKIVGHLRRITGSAQPWKTASYKLSSTLFTKQLLTMYSWTGASRTGITKKPFQQLVNILDVFYQVVKYADSTFSHSMKEQFFRDGILKHSNTRLNPKKRVTKSQSKSNILPDDLRNDHQDNEDTEKNSTSEQDVSDGTSNNINDPEINETNEHD